MCAFKTHRLSISDNNNFFRPIKEKDLRKCLDKNRSFTSKAYNKFITLMRTGHYVRDSTVEKFLNNQMENKKIEALSKQENFGKGIEKIYHRVLSKLVDEKGLDKLKDLRDEMGMRSGKLLSCEALNNLNSDEIKALNIQTIPKKALEELYIQHRKKLEELTDTQLWNLQHRGYEQDFSKPLMQYLSKIQDRRDVIRLSNMPIEKLIQFEQVDLVTLDVYLLSDERLIEINSTKDEKGNTLFTQFTNKQLNQLIKKELPLSVHETIKSIIDQRK